MVCFRNVLSKSHHHADLQTPHSKKLEYPKTSLLVAWPLNEQLQWPRGTIRSALFRAPKSQAELRLFIEWRVTRSRAEEGNFGRSVGLKL